MIHNPKPKKPAFGGLSNRFEYLGLHPSWERRGYTFRYPHVSPGCYHYEQRRKPKGIGYAESYKTEELSRTLGHRADHKLKASAWAKSINGPGWHDVKFTKSIKYGTFPSASRFLIHQCSSTPGPGIYGKEHIPHTRIEEKSKAKAFSFSDTPSFEYDNCMPRSIAVQRPYHLPPNIYKLKSTVDELLSKSTSKRGPYDLFTGARDETSLYGHLSRPDRLTFGSNLSSRDAVQYLNNSCNKYKGRFLKCGRETYPTMRTVYTAPVLCKPDLDRPAPNAYELQQLSKPTSIKNFPFNSSMLHARPLKKIELKPPPGRYEPMLKKRIIGNGMRSDFLSRVKRGIPLPKKMSWFE